MRESGFESRREIEQESALDWIRGIGSGAATGAVTGAAFGPLGALVGGVAGGALGAVQTGQQQSQRPSARHPSAAARPLASGPASDVSPLILQQLAQLVPLLTELLSRRSRPSGASPAPRGEEIGESGDAFYDDGSFLTDEAESQELRGIEEPIPDEDEALAEDGLEESPPAPEHPVATRFVSARYFGPRHAPRVIRRIVIHITDGGPNIESTIRWFQNPVKDGLPLEVSAHYIVGRNGEIVQMVRENDLAWHAGDANSDSIGIEHNARAARAGKTPLYPTPTQYCSSAALVRGLCERYSIPLDRVHVLGHAEADPGTRHRGCPNSVWDWDHYMDLLTSATCLPPPAGTAVGEEAESSSTEAESPENGDLADWTFESEGVIGFPTGWAVEELSDAGTALEWSAGELESV
jgi:N-acetyl-anhydromuramyl-L-alanine amidase AmpD